MKTPDKLTIAILAMVGVATITSVMSVPGEFYICQGAFFALGIFVLVLLIRDKANPPPNILLGIVSFLAVLYMMIAVIELAFDYHIISDGHWGPRSHADRVAYAVATLPYCIGFFIAAIRRFRRKAP